MEVYPIFLNRLNTNKTVLIGGNEEAERKANELLRAGANLTIISKHITSVMMDWKNSDEITWIKREYRDGDLKDAYMVIVAEYEGTINEKVWQEANRLGILCNVMDDIPHCNFTFGSLVKRGPLNIAVSTSGAAPALAVRIREGFEKEFGLEYEDFLDFMQSIRQRMKQIHPHFTKRKAVWYELIDSEVLELFRQGLFHKAKKLAEEIIHNPSGSPQTKINTVSEEKQWN
ncbi:MAG: bifunctional precorrin-2 dehydrogenase/sirohydrochlorin ferrochelatase [Balneolales bacterium]